MRKRIIVAADVETKAKAITLVKKLKDGIAAVKINVILFTKYGPDIVSALSKYAKVFLDLKYHDIPNTVENAVYEASKLGVSFLTIHSMGGKKMMKAAVKGVRKFQDETGKAGPALLAVTLLTSLSEADIATDLNMPYQASDMVMLLTETAMQSGMDGIVASPHETNKIKKQIGDKIVVTPGIRPNGFSTDDQSRIATPSEAIRSGADYLVIGRPIWRADNPATALDSIVEEINHE